MTPVNHSVPKNQAELILEDLAEQAAQLPEGGDCLSSGLEQLRNIIAEQGRLLAEYRQQIDRLEAECQAGSQREKKDHAAAERANEILESISDAFFTVDADWRLTYINRKAEEWWDRPRESLLGQVLWELFPDYVKAEGYQALLRAMQERAPIYIETFSPTIDIWVEVRIYPSAEGGLSVYFSDITERKQSGAALQAARAEMEEGRLLLEAVLEYLPEGIVITGGPPDFPIRRVSGYGLDLIGAGSRPEILGIPVGQHQDAWHIFLADGETRPEREQMPLYRASHAGEIVRNEEFVIQAADGKRIPVLVSAGPIRDQQGHILAAINTWRDFSERKAMEVSLRESEQRYHDLADILEVERAKLSAVIEHLPIGVGLEDPSGNPVSLNAAGLKLHGFKSQADMFARLDQYLDEVEMCYLDGRVIPMPELPAYRALRGDFVRDFELLYRNKRDGSERILSYSFAPIKNRQGETVLISFVFQNLTELKMATEALQRSEQRARARRAELEAVMDAVPAFIWITHDVQAQVMTGNRMTLELMRMQPGDNLSKSGPGKENLSPFITLQDGHEIPPDQLPIQLTAATGKPVRDYAFDMVFPDGEMRHLLGNASPLFDEEGKQAGAVGVFLDMTRIQQLEAEQIEAKAHIEVQQRLMELRESERQGIARDLHDGPIQSLSSMAFTVQIVKEAFPDPNLRLELEQIAVSVQNAVRELREIVNDLRPPALIRFGLARAIRMHAEDMQERYPNVAIELELSENGRQLSDQARMTLFRIFQEGLNNILHHAQASQVWVTFQISADEFMLELRDNGVGFTPPKDLSLLASDGHFGLVGMNERAQTVGGQLSINSAPGQGTKVVVRGPFLGKNIKDR